MFLVYGFYIISYFVLNALENYFIVSLHFALRNEAQREFLDALSRYAAHPRPKIPVSIYWG